MNPAAPNLITEVPGPRSRELAAELGRYECRNVTGLSDEFPIFWDRAHDHWVWDVDGNCFLDWTSAFAVTSLGHGAEPLRQRLHEQVDQLWHAMGDVHPPSLKPALCRKLSEITFERWGAGPARVTLANSGFEAVEIALKTSWLHSHRPGVIAFRGGYHGLGFGAAEVTGWPYFQEPFRGILPKFVTLVDYPTCASCPFAVEEGFRLEGEPFPNCSSYCLQQIEQQVRQAIDQKEIGAVLVEPCLGRGGDVLPPRDFLPRLRQICDETKTLLILDEIYTGFNRTGRLFASEWFEVIPDLVCLGKAMSGGFPISACVGKRTVMDAWPASSGEALHTSTHLGNPLGCAMALTAIEQHLEAGLAGRVRELGRFLLARLRELRHPAILDVRGTGLMHAIEFTDTVEQPAVELVGNLMIDGLKNGYLLLGGGSGGNVLSLTPPFTIDEAVITRFTNWLQEYLMSLPGSISKS